MPNKVNSSTAKLIIKLKTAVKASLLGGIISLSPITQALTIIPDAPQINAKGYILIDYISTG